MTVSAFDLFSIGIGPSSSHTVGPMRAAYRFLQSLIEQQQLITTARLQLEIFGSLAWTGQGHGTEAALLMGLEGEQPEDVQPQTIAARVADIKNKQQLNLNAEHLIGFADNALVYNRKDLLPQHSNAMRFTAYSHLDEPLLSEVYYSVGGGFVLMEHDFQANTANKAANLPHPFASAAELLALCTEKQLRISELVWLNERYWRSDQQIEQQLLAIWQVMDTSINNGCRNVGTLPGKLQVKRRAAAIYEKLCAHAHPQQQTTETMNWLSVYAIAVNEENAAGGRVVTAPTNGAAGIIPAVLRTLLDSKMPVERNTLIIDFLLTAAAIGSLYKENASISAAEVGCQGEVGVACSMAAAAYAAVCGASLPQIENAAEIAMEHHLGLTCDPIAGLVQIPCIERNAMGAVQAVNAARLALLEDGQHKVSLDDVINTMRQTGRDMLSKYKETAQGGLAVNVPDC